MAGKDKNDEPRRRVTKTNLLLGAAGLFLFIVGVKRTFRPGEIPAAGDDLPAEQDAREGGGDDGR
ncbi:MAG: hypothetical protein AVDCRST_MAG68-3490 [uncultured Gemmatimonadetes bacterium]|uniref:Uncharacterized protein n=1 Tax=uncultured Gemmatimonadota bacterium TaxID=203437 RepID=A0A6J4M933_9BACT|nr:MAG: hypothetical protein AVDCRST_MAG68-3490 [uncultured Gemmatimonadota bacterium]